ncbi:MAG TPA: hypothetical protein VGF13_09825 [Verrucomicrobiae bacterium]|jgi:hypothetical protein
MSPEIIWIGTGVLIEQPNSPHWNFAERVTATQIFKGQYALARASCPPKGALGLGEFAGMRVESSSVVPERMRVGVLTITYEGPPDADGDPQLPSDECDIDYAQQDFDIRSHPYFGDLTKEDLWAAEAFANSSDFQTADAFQWLESGVNSEKTLQLIERLQRGQEKYPLFPPLYTFTSYFLDDPGSDGGGYLQEPFGTLTAPGGWDWLRLGDKISHNGTFWKLTRSWLASELWDPLIFS